MSSSYGIEGPDSWPEYYEHFPYFTPDAIRDGCHPRAMEHEASTGKAIVLVHGLTDSPYFLLAIAHHFYANLGYNVYLPLLHCHGLKEPKGSQMVDDPYADLLKSATDKKPSDQPESGSKP